MIFWNIVGVCVCEREIIDDVPGWAQVFLLRNVETSLGKLSSLAQLGKPRVLVWKRDRGRGWMLQH